MAETHPHGASAVYNVGHASSDNSTFANLASGATFTGRWEEAPQDQVAVNVAASHSGTLYVELSSDGGKTISETHEEPITAGKPLYRAYFKAARSVRVRYVNGSGAQTAFTLGTFFGNNLGASSSGVPGAIGLDEEPVYFAYSSGEVTQEGYVVLVDLSDTEAFPHEHSGYLELHSFFVFVDKTANSAGAVQAGVITRIDATSADIEYVQGVSFNSTSERSFSRDRVFNYPLSLQQGSGELTGVATLFKDTNVTAVNTSTPLPGTLGNVTPAVGDLVCRLGYTTGGAYTAAISGQYTGNASETV